LKRGLTVTAAAMASGEFSTSLWSEHLVTLPGIQLYTIDKELNADVEDSLTKIRAIWLSRGRNSWVRRTFGEGFSRRAREHWAQVQQFSLLQLGSGDLNQIFEAANDLGGHYTVTSAMGRFTDQPVGRTMGAPPLLGSRAFWHTN